MRWSATALAFGVATATGCVIHSGGDDQENVRSCPDFEPQPFDPAGTSHVYVVNSIDLAETAADAQRLGLDLDGDPKCRPDNAMGQIASTVAAHFGGYDLDVEVTLLIEAGAMLHLIDVEATSLDDAAGVRVTISHADDFDGDPSDNFTGLELFGVDDARGSGSATGRIFPGGLLSTTLGTAPMAITFPGLDDAFVLPLVGVRIEAEIAPGGVVGRMGGAMLEEDVQQTVIPLFAEALDRIIARDCPEQDGQRWCPPGSDGEELVRLFDEDGDFTISPDDLRDSELLSSLVAPDVDLFDADGTFAPRTDKVKDALSIGFGFTAVPARLEPLPRVRRGPAGATGAPP